MIRCAPVALAPATTWGMLSSLRGRDEEARRAGLRELALRYWKPVYRFARVAWAKSNEDAKDLAQAFFLWMTEEPALDSYDPAKGGFRTFLKILDGGRISIGALAVGLAQAALDASIPYAQTREQFGRAIGTFQGVAFMVADMATEIEAARSLVWKSAWLKDQGRDYGLVAAEAKLFASEVSSRATNAAIQIHGGNGIMSEYPVSRAFGDAKVLEIVEGASEIQRMIISRDVLR